MATILAVYLTGYSWHDNTPAGSAVISNPVIHQEAGGIGTYEDPITLAVGKNDLKSTLPYGRIVYIESLQLYAIVEDYCSGCTSGWIDLWVDGRNKNKDFVDKYMRSITGDTRLFLDPPSDLPVKRLYS